MSVCRRGRCGGVSTSDTWGSLPLVMAVLPADTLSIAIVCAQVKYPTAYCHTLSFVPGRRLGVASCPGGGNWVWIRWEFGVMQRKGIACFHLYMHTITQCAHTLDTLRHTLARCCCARCSTARRQQAAWLDPPREWARRKWGCSCTPPTQNFF